MKAADLRKKSDHELRETADQLRSDLYDVRFRREVDQVAEVHMSSDMRMIHIPTWWTGILPPPSWRPRIGGAVPDGSGSNQSDASRARVLEFLQRHTAYELIPESNKVVVLDTELPVRRAFHACYEQGITAAPLWDERAQAFVGMLSAGDFIDITQIIGPDLAAAAVSEQELDAT